jgi:hypothetical protein
MHYSSSADTFVNARVMLCSLPTLRTQPCSELHTYVMLYSLFTMRYTFVTNLHFICYRPQIGMAEMRDMVLATGGVAVQTDTFHNVVFKVSQA